MALAIRTGLPVDYWLDHPDYLTTALAILEEDTDG